MIGDLIGRMSAKWFIVVSESTILVCVYARFLFWLLFLIPHVTDTGFSDYVAFTGVFFMAISNGYLASILMMFGPSKVAPEMKPVAGTLMVMFLTFGIFAGSMFSLGLSFWL